MVGYGERGVYLLYLGTGKVVRSWDVVFKEGRPNCSLSPLGGEDMEGGDQDDEQDIGMPRVEGSKEAPELKIQSTYLIKS